MTCEGTARTRQLIRSIKHFLVIRDEDHWCSMEGRDESSDLVVAWHCNV